ncbi:MAG TPA: type 2 isopentenyl-diphosphate Delta-isomerase [Spirochaetia bacterium]|nr:type 2 isopentenyl-diphosphate Delta-isomerase [Spirochaetia bacterium]
MPTLRENQKRKIQHRSICSNPKRYPIETAANGFEQYRINHRAFPEIDFSEIDTRCYFLDTHITLPIFISSMTGGDRKGTHINKILASAAEALGIPLGTGSIRIALEHEELSYLFNLRSEAPTVPIFGNIGAVQLAHCDWSKLNRLVEQLKFSALAVHCNPGQELFQEEGDRDFRGIKDKLAAFIAQAPFPVIVKETGFGFAPDELAFLASIGARYIDVAGKGGANWILIEGWRSGTIDAAYEFADWGYSTAEMLEKSPKQGILLASGGIRTAHDVIVALGLGAVACGIALPIFRAVLSGGTAGVIEYVSQLAATVKKKMFLAGCKSVQELSRPGVIEKNPDVGLTQWTIIRTL